MLFKPEMIEAIREGRKTQTRRVVRTRETCTQMFGGGIYTVLSEQGRLKWRVGETYAICPGRGQKAVGRLLLERIRREPLREITNAEAQAEGCEVAMIGPVNGFHYYSALLAFRDLWDSINTGAGIRWEDNPEVWVLEFHPVEWTA